MSKGLHYKKMDLHVHTPASADFKPKSITPKQIVAKAIALGLDAIAITDHNSGEWIDRIKKAAKGKKLSVFPGVEINVTGGKKGVHIIGLFDCTKTTKHIEGLLSSLGFCVDDYGKTDSISNKSVYDVIQTITNEQHNGIAVLAHANSTKGVLNDMQGSDRKKIVALKELLGVESTDYGNADKKKKKKRLYDLLDGNDPEYKRKMAVYQASDNPGKKSGTHDLDGVGKRYSYFKVDEDVTLESIRQCFIDPDVRIRQMTEYCQYSYPRIDSIEISDGFLGGETISFHEGLNSIFGSKGVGKSLIVEYLRFALDQTSQNKSIRIDTNSKLTKRLGPLGKIKVTVQLENGTKYDIERTYDESADSPIECENAETKEVYNGKIAELFPILAYSQTEIIKIAEDENAQLELIDKFIDHTHFIDAIEKLNEKLRINDKKIAKSIKANSEVINLTTDINTFNEQLKNIDKSLKNKLFEEYKVWETKKLNIEKSQEYINNLIEQVEEFIESFEGETPPEIKLGDKKDLLLKKCIDLMDSSVTGTLSSLEEIKVKLEENKTTIEERRKKWIVKYEKKKKDYENLLEKLGGNRKTLEGKRRRLEKSKGEKETELSKWEKAMKDFAKYRQERNEMLDSLDKIKKEYYEARKKEYDELSSFSNRKLLLSISHSTNRETFAKRLKALKKGTHLREKDMEKIANKVMPRQFVDAVIDNKADELAKRTSLPLENVKKLIDELNLKEDMREVLNVQHENYPLDTPSIEFRKPNGKYDPLKDLSVGQKCTALLIIALSEGSMPIIIDQPEDSLDLLSVYNDIVVKLRSGKEERQFILTTHNSNVAVASDSDMFLLVDSSADKGHVESIGTIDNKEMKKKIIEGLEGGEDPHLLKIRKYNVKH